MNQPLKLPIADAEVFAATKPPSLADILARGDGELSGNELRDTRSAFRFLAGRGSVNLGATPATPERLRQCLGTLNAERLEISEKRLANIRSLIRQAVGRFGPRRTWITHKVELAPAWKSLLATIQVRQYRWALNRLAAYCTIKDISPNEVTSETLVGFQVALAAVSLAKDPANIRKHTIAIWNMCLRQVPGWPQVALASPFKPEAFMLPLDAFPEGFRADVEAWCRRMQNPDPLDLEAPVHALRPATLHGYVMTFRRLASGLVHDRGVPVEAITGVGVLVEGDNLKDGLRSFLGNGRTQEYAAKMATQMRNVAKYFLGLPRNRIDEIERLISRLRPPGQHSGMGERNRKRLAQFDDAAVVQRFLNLPQVELDSAMHKKNPRRRAKGVERALLISLSIFMGLRAKNLRSLCIDRNIRRSAGRVFVELFGDETKNYAELTLELPAEAVELLDRFLADHRPVLPGADGQFLFPGPNGGPRSYSAIRDAIGVRVMHSSGIAISPHLYRHIVAKIVVERRPEMIFDVSRRLGHKRVGTTYGAYLGTETPAASRRINELLEAIGNDPKSAVASRSATGRSAIRGKGKSGR